MVTGANRYGSERSCQRQEARKYISGSLRRHYPSGSAGRMFDPSQLFKAPRFPFVAKNILYGYFKYNKSVDVSMHKNQAPNLRAGRLINNRMKIATAVVPRLIGYTVMIVWKERNFSKTV